MQTENSAYNPSLQEGMNHLGDVANEGYKITKKGAIIITCVAFASFTALALAFIIPAAINMDSLSQSYNEMLSNHKIVSLAQESYAKLPDDVWKNLNFEHPNLELYTEQLSPYLNQEEIQNLYDMFKLEEEVAKSADKVTSLSLGFGIPLLVGIGTVKVVVVVHDGIKKSFTYQERD